MNHTSIEPLETRIAPAAVFTFIDVDGDAVTVNTSKGTNADLAAVITTNTPAGSVAGGKRLDEINLAMNTVFDGTDLSVTAKPGPLGGDGLANVVSINAAGLDLGTIKISGNLGDLDAGKNTITSKIKTIDLQSTSGAFEWDIKASVGSLKVARDLKGVQIVLGASGATLGLLQIGGSLIGEFTERTGFVHVPDGNIGKVIIKGSIVGGTNEYAGYVVAEKILSVTIGGNLLGGAGVGSGGIFATESIGPVTIKGDIRGGTEILSGRIYCGGKLGNVTIGGSLIGGAAGHAGSIEGVGGVGKVTIGRDMRGGGAADAGDIQSVGGGIAGVKIGGSLIGGTASFSGRIIALGGNIGPIQIGGDLASNDSPTGTLLSDNGVIYAELGAFNDAPVANIASITIGGSIRGASTASGGGQIYADGTIKAVKIGRDVLGGNGQGSGAIYGTSGILSASIGGNLIGAGGANSALLFSSETIGVVKIGGSILGGTGVSSAGVFSTGKLGNVTIGGDLIAENGSGIIIGNSGIGAVKIGGDLLGKSTSFATIRSNGVSDGPLAIKSITIGGRVERTSIVTAFAGTQIGPVKVGGDWIASNLITGIDSGNDFAFGTADDVVSTSVSNPALVSKIASIVIGGQVSGTSGGTDHFGFVSQEIGSLKIHGVNVPLTAGKGNDTDVNNTHFILGATRDVTVHEVL